MQLWYSFLLVATGASALLSPTGLDKRQSALDTWIASEKTVAKTGLYANIGPDGSKDQGAASGVVIASPSKVDPGAYKS